eukprot:CAMPEP_0173095354 /NCGR_PEP_ID=MMETSP1102-20130122/31844_1 /TAXON_ID=49646 /ORGANISM="Geminigera sp., Strain Caron Lab Isolate" /LENGTH=67 /DNA_ID=CAMNT_0013985161 /DNA_START=153 /DNA_END=353 /DNA_ORIENTATION=-
MASSQRMEFATALYFAVTSISTAGLEAIQPFSSYMDALDITEQPYAFYTEDQYQYHFAFVSLYTFFG